MKLLIVFFISLLVSCGKFSNVSGDDNSIFQNFTLTLFRNNKLTIGGTALKGIVKNATVTISPLNADGTCNNTNVLASGNTDNNGDYSLTYNRTGSAVCLTVSGDPRGNTKMFDEKESADLALTSNSNFKQTSIIVESKLTGNTSKRQLISPFSNLLAKRLQYLTKQSGSNTNLATLHTKASKEVVIRFGLSTLSSASGRATTSSINENDYPELDDITLNLKNPTDLLSAKSLSVLAGISYLANKIKTGSKTTPNDINTVIEALATDFEDGLFDGKGSDGKPITIGAGANIISFSSAPLTTILFPAIVSYVQEGGILTAGISGTSPITISTAQITSQTQFVDNAIILSGAVTPTATGTGTPTGTSTGTGTGTGSGASPISLSYTGSPYFFPMNIPITPITPNGGGTFTSCTVSPSLLAGLSLNNTTCAVSGTPTSLQSAVNYTITATSSSGSASATISISVTSDGSAWTARTLPLSQQWYSVAYGSGVFVAVAWLSATAASSPDGITWTSRTMPSSSAWKSVTYGNGTFVAIAQSSTIAATSPDGINWTSRTLPNNVQWISVTYGNGVFVVVSQGSSTAATSPDGINWTSQTLPSPAQWMSVAYGNGVFVAVAGAPSTTAASSPDGVTWTARTLPSFSQWMSITYGNGVFVAVTVGPSTAAATSPDGINWTARTLPSSASWYSVSYGSGIFSAVTNSTVAATSPDGINWTNRTLPISANWYSVTYGNGIFVGVAHTSTSAITSP